jgi:hypothetical protein
VAAQSSATFDDLAAAYVAEYELRGHRTLSTARARADHLQCRLGGMLAAAILALHITRYQTSRRAEGAATVNRETAALDRMLVIGRRTGLLTTLPGLWRW